MPPARQPKRERLHSSCFIECRIKIYGHFSYKSERGKLFHWLNSIYEHARALGCCDAKHSSARIKIYCRARGAALRNGGCNDLIRTSCERLPWGGKTSPNLFTASHCIAREYKRKAKSMHFIVFEWCKSWTRRITTKGYGLIYGLDSAVSVYLLVVM